MENQEIRLMGEGNPRRPPTSSECVVSGSGIQKDKNSCEEDHNPCEERVMVNNANQPSGDDDSAGILGLQDFGLRTSPLTNMIAKYMLNNLFKIGKKIDLRRHRVLGSGGGPTGTSDSASKPLPDSASTHSSKPQPDSPHTLYSRLDVAFLLPFMHFKSFFSSSASSNNCRPQGNTIQIATDITFVLDSPGSKIGRYFIGIAISIGGVEAPYRMKALWVRGRKERVESHKTWKHGDEPQNTCMAELEGAFHGVQYAIDEVLPELDGSYHIMIKLDRRGAVADLEKRIYGEGIKKEAMKYRAQDTIKLLEKHYSRIASCRTVWVHRDTDRVAHNFGRWWKRNILKGKQEIVLSVEDLLGFLKNIHENTDKMGINMDVVKKDLMLKIKEEKAAGGGRRWQGCWSVSS
ncbi:hypothetical protein OROHE_023115 [Orobanche hederae]